MSSRRLAFVAAAACFILLASTAPGIPIVWDEGEYLGRADRIIDWFRLVRDRSSPLGGLQAFSESVIRDHWMFVTWSEGHPAWAVIPIATAKMLLSGMLHQLTAARLGTISVFSLACGVVAFRLRKSHGTVAAVVAVTTLVTFPRMFSEAHFATLDAQLTAWWLMLWAVDVAGRADVESALSAGALAGLTSATKFTGWLAWIPLIVSQAFSRDRWRRLALLLVVLPVGLVVFCAVNPPLWHHPINGLLTHFELNAHRTLNVPIAFLGRVYDLNHTLPWYNTIVWLFFVTPVPVLILGAVGLVHCLRTRDMLSISLVLHWATLMVVRGVPGAPPHDGVRLFLPAFGFWCVFAGIGAQQAWEWSREQISARRGVFLRATIVLALAADAVNVARYFPQTLSHYNLLVGGVRGAARLGMEPTYWWDALDGDVLTWLNGHTGPDERVAFSSTANISLLRAWGRLRPAQAPRDGVFKWYVFQNRTAFLAESDRRLMQNFVPAYTKFAGNHPAGSEVPIDLNVPLLFVFSYDQHKAAANGP